MFIEAIYGEIEVGLLWSTPLTYISHLGLVFPPKKKNKIKHVPKHQPDYEIPIVLRHYSPSTSIIHIPSDSHPPFFWAIRWKEKRQVTLRLPQAKTTWGDEERGDKLENAPDFS